MGVVTTVNVGYEDNVDVKGLKGRVEEWIEERGDPGREKIEWEEKAPERIKCWDGVWEKPRWGRWNISFDG